MIAASRYFIPSQRGEIARDGVALALAQRSHEFRHVEVVGSLVAGKFAHFPDQVFITEPGQPRRRHAALEVRLVTGLALGDAFRRRGRLCRRPPRRPGLGREIGGHLAQVALVQALGDGCHDRARALAVPEIAQLLHEVALLLAPDGRNGLGVGGNAVLPMARRAELRFRLDLIRGMRRRDGDRKADPHSENRRTEACDHDEIPPSPPRGQSVAGYRICRGPVFHGESLMRAKLMLTLAATAAAMVFPPASSIVRAESDAALTGVVSSEAEGKMEGVVVTARRAKSIVQVSVTTDAEGRYSFPRDRLQPGQYTLSIRAVGYDIDSPATATVADEDAATADMKLKKTRNLAGQL